MTDSKTLGAAATAALQHWLNLEAIDARPSAVPILLRAAEHIAACEADLAEARRLLLIWDRGRIVDNTDRSAIRAFLARTDKEGT